MPRDLGELSKPGNGEEGRILSNVTKMYRRMRTEKKPKIANHHKQPAQE